MPATRHRPAFSARSGKLSFRLRLRTLRKDQEGATALEFALIAPVLFLLTFGTLEMGLAMLAQQIMESATFTASRLGKTGYSANGNFEDQTARLTAMRKILNDRAGILLDANKISITTKAYNQFDQIGQPEPFIDTNGNGIRDEGENYTDVNMNGKYDSDMGADGLGNAKQVVVYTVTYPWTLKTPFIGRVMGNNGVLNLSARTVVQNEPY
ncbi:TadE/TadG family type IV pilus assembly protein [Govanella unica]|uniref:Pilus assembly protein n=1 Tax=Govanella unica TaxID=2975056 RepID=A0A9X3TY61_9PROT|nr:TadE family protein [Govania unica]MDA5193918.1 pilus assembly protein [Govania unica]